MAGVTEISNVEEFVNEVPIVVTLAVCPPNVELLDVEIRDMVIEELYCNKLTLKSPSTEFALVRSTETAVSLGRYIENRSRES